MFVHFPKSKRAYHEPGIPLPLSQSLPYIQFHRKLETTNSRFWLVNILLLKFDTLSKKEMKMIKTQILWWWKTTRKKNFIKALSNIFLWTPHTDPWCNMLQTLERRRKYIGVILSDEHTYHIYYENVAKYSSDRQT